MREPDLSSGELVPFRSMADVLFAVHEGDLDLGVVPIENAIEGTVNATIDTLAFDVDLLIQRELRRARAAQPRRPARSDASPR